MPLVRRALRERVCPLLLCVSRETGNGIRRQDGPGLGS